MKAYVIDGNSLLFRGFYATSYGEGPIMRTKGGVPTNAIYAFGNMIARILHDVEKGDALFVAFDADGHTFRKEEYEGYKATRRPCPEDLVPQFPISREMLDALGICHYEEHGVEADDIAGSLAKSLSREGYEVYLYTSDRDYLQLIDERVKVLLPQKGLSETKVMDLASLKEEMGISPAQIVDYKGLRGDDSDNLPGIRGVGEKTALKLLAQYGTFPAIMEHKDEIPGKLGEKVRDGEKEGWLSYRLARIKTDVALPFEEKEVLYRGYDEKKAAEFAAKYEFRSFLQRLPAALRGREVPRKERRRASSFLELSREGRIAVYGPVHKNDYHREELEGLALSDGERSLFVPRERILKEEGLREFLGDEKGKKVAFDRKSLEYSLETLGISLKGVEEDVLLLSYLLDSNGKGDPEETFLSQGIALPEGTGEERALSIAESSLDALPGMLRRIQEEGTKKLYYEIELPLAHVLARMEREGIPLRKDLLEEFGEEYRRKRDEAREKVLSYAKEETNLNSPSQVARLLYDDLGLPMQRGRTTSVEALRILADLHPAIPALLEYRKYQKLLSTYVEGLVPHIFEDGKIHTYFNQSETSTGRLSSSQPNLQNISARDEESRLIRKAFLYEEEDIGFLSLDYSQIELRILAEMSKSPGYRALFLEGHDVHSETARRIFGKEEVTHEERRKAKAVNFAIIYGTTIHGLADQIGVPYEEARAIIDSFYGAYPEIKEFLDKIVRGAEEKGYVETMLGRRRYLREIHDPSFPRREAARRAAMNAPIQGSAADLIKAAMVKVGAFLEGKEETCRLILQVHDELIFACRKDKAEEMGEALRKIMEEALPMEVPLKAEIGFGRSWYEAKE